jgi:septal ring factor EnvC (AmiA/AmiB activator)
MSGSLVRNQFGHVEDVENDIDYTNLDYRYTLAPLWNTLRDMKKSRKDCKNDQEDINLAMCASIIQLGKNMNQQFECINERLNKMEGKINNQFKKMTEGLNALYRK